MTQFLPSIRQRLSRPSRSRQTRRTISVLGSRVSVLESGSGWPIVLVHGNFSSSYVWRDIIPYIDSLGQCAAIDLIGMGRSERVGQGPTSYTLADQRTYFDAFMESFGFDANVILVGIEWGASIVVDWAMRHPSAVRGVAYMEMYLSSLTWRDFPVALRQHLRRLQADAEDELILDSDFVRREILPMLTLSQISEETADEYLLGFDVLGESRRSVASLVQEIPVNGKPADVAEWMDKYDFWMEMSPVPKLRILGNPGLVMNGKRAERTDSFANQTTVQVEGVHLLPEDDPKGVGEGLAQWIWGLE